MNLLTGTTLLWILLPLLKTCSVGAVLVELTNRDGDVVCSCDTLSTSMNCTGSTMRVLPSSVAAECVNLRSMDLSSNELVDISSLSSLTRLTMLDLSFNRLSDISPLAALSQLTALNLGDNKLSDISPLSRCTQLKQLVLFNNKVTDVTPLATCTKVTELVLSNNLLSDITALSTLTKVTALGLYGNRLSDITALSALTRMTEILLNNNQLSDISPIADLTQLTSMTLSNNQLSDVASLAAHTRLTYLDLNNNNISNITSLSGLSQVTALFLHSNRLSDITPLSELTKLKELLLFDNKISDVSALSTLTRLQYIDLHRNNITGVSPSVVTNLRNSGAFFMEDNPSVCTRVLETTTLETSIVCDCAKGFYGTDFCASIEDKFVELPGVISALSQKCFHHSDLAAPFCPATQITLSEIYNPEFGDAQVPTQGTQFAVNVTSSKTMANVTLAWVYSAFKVQNAEAMDYILPPPPIISMTAGLYTTLDKGSYEVLPNPNIPTNITYSTSSPLPKGVSFSSTDTWFVGKPMEASPASIGQFNITMVATEHFTGQKRVAARVLLSVAVCGAKTCNQHGRCSVRSSNPYEPVCTCADGYSGRYCETPTNTQIDNHSSLAHWVTPVIVVVVLVLLAAAMMVYYWKSRRVKRLQLSVGLTEQLLSDRDEELQEIHSSWDIPWEDLTLGREIGTGAFGSVVKAVWQGNEVAVKQMKTDEDVAADLFEKEVRSMTLLRHPNLVLFYGTGIDITNSRFLVVEYLAKGSLRDVLNNQNISLEWSKQMRMCFDIALGMAFLHTRSPPVMHRDLKTDNCFVSSSWTVKVGDFGSILRSPSLEIPQKDIVDTDLSQDTLGVTATFGCGTPLWMAPEVIATAQFGAAHYGLPADVYSYGIVMFEVATRTYPYADQDTVTVMALLDQIQKGMRPTIPSHLPEEFVALMRRCWASEQRTRPIFSQVCRWFE